MPYMAPWGDTRFDPEAEARVKERHRLPPLLGSPQERQGKAEETAQNWLVRIIPAGSGAWTPVPSCLVPGSGLI